MMFYKEHGVLLTLPEGKLAVRKYNSLGKVLVQYELAYYDAWQKHSVRTGEVRIMGWANVQYQILRLIYSLFESYSHLI